MRDKQLVMRALRETGIVAVIRTDNPSALVDVAKALRDGGVKFIEITMTVPKALSIIEDAVERLAGGDVYIGAGTVLDAETARAAINAGAAFVVGPAFDQGMVDVCKLHSTIVMAGGLTPTEIVTAWKGGADVVKVFPAQNVGGADYIKAIKEPLPQIELIPTKGVDFETAAGFIKAGSLAVGVGGALLGKSLMAEKNYAAITENAKRMAKLVAEAKAAKAG
jgi:2-dehydro-3-deoxyphosphogluconate aldolase / (4S)-4-hydroxy-2-oxoglutarate aldolase